MTEMAGAHLAFRAIVTGRVQGVAFRWSTVREAGKWGAQGWVRNLADGSVEAYVVGSSEQLDKMRDFLGRGPSHARVDHLELTELEVGAPCDGFSIRDVPTE